MKNDETAPASPICTSLLFSKASSSQNTFLPTPYPRKQSAYIGATPASGAAMPLYSPGNCAGTKSHAKRTRDGRAGAVASARARGHRDAAAGRRARASEREHAPPPS